MEFINLLSLPFNMMAPCYRLNVCASPPPIPYVEALTPNGVVLGDGAFVK